MTPPQGISRLFGVSLCVDVPTGGTKGELFGVEDADELPTRGVRALAELCPWLSLP